jgi:hypothetical protein
LHDAADSTCERTPSGRSRHPLELDQPADVVTEVHHPDLESRPLANQRDLICGQELEMVMDHQL